ncbi:serine/threonine protein kinase [Galdieria sulphuraria]|uniref:Serine/threonine protein kinase n=1 Tax=Galdieria sulphuraria TaxID=130081 RepID=M2XGI9_GALSU|nr:serine/threonine protein kinase [Galdieria sulphuraria]EME29177.1 serine/threonine protein kinase [Galdieria sulphuraria]|eukprot:XP_005705697.1 serine/threonine protein kinase [Galdieria sulphuraria]
MSDLFNDRRVTWEDPDGEVDVVVEEGSLAREEESDSFRQDEENYDVENSSKTCFPVWEAKWSRKAKVERVLRLRPETEPHTSEPWFSRSRMRLLADSPAVYLIDSILIIINLLIFLSKYIVMFRTAWTLDASSRYAYIVTTWLQTGANLLVWTIFSIETLLRIYTWGRVQFFKQRLNIVDFTIVSFLGITCIIELVLFAPVTRSSLDVNVEWDVQLVQLFHVIFSTLRFVVVIRLGTAENLRRKAYRTAQEMKETQVARGLETSWLVKENEVQFGEQIGIGAVGVVYLGLWQGTLVAVKQVLCPHLDLDSRKTLEHEVRINSLLRHPNIVLFMGVIFHSDQSISLLSEYCEKGSLQRLIYDKQFDLNYTFIMKFSVDAAQGLAYLHSRSPPILHRDLKSANLLVDSSWNLKIADFGMSAVLSNIHQDGALGTIQYTAPEVLRNERPSQASDIYSLGMVLWEMGARELPFKGKNRYELFIGKAEHGVKPDIHKCELRTSCKYISLVNRCLSFEPGKRPSAVNLIELLHRLIDEDSDISAALLSLGEKDLNTDSILFNGV